MASGAFGAGEIGEWEFRWVNRSRWFLRGFSGSSEGRTGLTLGFALQICLCGWYICQLIRTR